MYTVTGKRIAVFGEVLFDIFPTGEQVLGGAPFNVAWHLHAFGDQPSLISRVGNDKLGSSIISAMKNWGMNIDNIQVDSQHPTGRVEVEFIDNDPSYNIKPGCAYDYIQLNEISHPPQQGILYHGSLGLRNEISRQTLDHLTENKNLSIFLDVNLRPPWWNTDNIEAWLTRADWVKLNQDEIRQLGYTSSSLEKNMTQLHTKHQLKHLIVTCGEQGAIVCDEQQIIHRVKPEKCTDIIDTVGAGDAFTSVYIHGLVSGTPVDQLLEQAQQFASKIIGLRGATTSNREFYQLIS